MRFIRRWCAGLAVAMGSVALGQVSPEASIKTFKVAEGVECTLFAAEPMLVNPCDIDVDAMGRVWVCEGANYRQWAKPPLRPEGDRIVILEDTDGDGRADKSTVFYQGLEINSALGICVLGNRVLVSCSPNIFLFTDTDGDGKADKKEVIFSGISGFQHDHGAHTFVFGPDGKIYFNLGNEGRQLKTPEGKDVVDVAGNVVAANRKMDAGSRSGPYRQGMVFRMNPPWEGKLELETLGWNFRNNYEVNVDSFGTMWQSDNDDDGNMGVRINYVMEFGNYGYTDEMTGAGWQQKRTDMEVDAAGKQDKPRQHWHQNSPGVVPNLLGTGNGSPCGICVYEGDLLPEIFRGQMIHCDAGPNVVRAYPVVKDGAGYKASTAPLIIGGDKWFRPSDVCTAPDGSVMVSDWYDPGVGGHAMGDNKADSLKGRIFRLAPPGKKYQAPELSVSNAQGAAEALRSPNLARRSLGWVALHEMGEKAEGELKKLWGDANPRIRARAIHLLARIPGKSEQYLNAAIEDQDADMRICGVRIARELKLDVIPVVRQLVNDSSAAVRRDCAIALRHSKSPAAADLWADLAMKHDGKDRWYLEALGIGADGNEDGYFDALMAKAGSKLIFTPAGRDVVWRSRAKKAAGLLAIIIASPETKGAERARYFRAFDFHSGPEKEEALLELLDNKLAKLDNAALAETVTRLKGRNDARVKPIVDRVLSAAAGKPEFVELVEQFDVKDRNEEVLAVVLANPAGQSAASGVRVLMKNGGGGLLERALAGPEGDKLAMALGSSPEKAVAEMLAGLVRDEGRTLAARKAAVRAMAKSTSGARGLLGMIRNGALGADLKSVAASELHISTDAKIRADAAALMPLPPTKDGQALPPIAKLMQMKGDAGRGREVYKSVCIQCHQVGNEGTNFGPALTEVGDKLSREAMYTAILYPSAGIEHNYQGQIVKIKGGDELVGIVQSETAEEIQLRIAGGIVMPIKKGNIVSRREQKESIMPEDLQKGMTVGELGDLVEYLVSLKKK
ncbi:MAG TPA: PVC-type heme-binding CxxCH protein [Tepidisphaeraceae bacterium]|nr:PVC-type heme-binding CxxCH protein [Tepidisphaeraceae bacterium]